MSPKLGPTLETGRLILRPPQRSDFDGVAELLGDEGYAREAATVAIDWAFDHLQWTEVIHSIDPDNRASQVLARKLES